MTVAAITAGDLEAQRARAAIARATKLGASEAEIARLRANYDYIYVSRVLTARVTQMPREMRESLAALLLAGGVSG